MCKSLLLLLPLLLHVVAAAASLSTNPDPSASPIIGVLTQEVYSDGLISRHFDNKTSYIAASYVKFLEGAGARVVPIWIGRNRSYYENLMQNINGVLLPGGATWFNQSDGYGDAGEHLINIAMEINDNGTFMPIWGTCLGMELLVYKLAKGVEARTDCSSMAQPLPLEFKTGYQQSRMFGGASDDIIDLLARENVTLNSHQFCYTEQSFAELQLDKFWSVLTLNHDWNGIRFISSIEHVNYPFYAVQFHPEKPLYEFNAKGAIPHTAAAVKCSQYFADFFVNEARRNPNSFNNASEQALSLIYNYKPEYTSPLGSVFVQQYLFTDMESGLTVSEREEVIDDDDDGLQPHYPYDPNVGGGADSMSSLFINIGLALCLLISLRS